MRHCERGGGIGQGRCLGVWWCEKGDGTTGLSNTGLHRGVIKACIMPLPSQVVTPLYTCLRLIASFLRPSVSCYMTRHASITPSAPYPSYVLLYVSPPLRLCHAAGFCQVVHSPHHETSGAALTAGLTCLDSMTRSSRSNSSSSSCWCVAGSGFEDPRKQV
jgi:hypothetical protein